MKNLLALFSLLVLIPALAIAAPAQKRRSRAPAKSSIRSGGDRLPNNAKRKSTAPARKAESPKPTTPPPAVTATKSEAKAESQSKSSYYGRAYLTLLQEPLDLKSGSNKARVDAQSLGGIVEIGKMTPLSGPRWRSLIGLNFGAGTLKAKGDTAAIADELKGQPWYAFGAHWGLLYRTTAHSEIKVVLPAYYRFISWSLSSASPLKPDKESSLSVGIGIEHLTRVSKSHAFVVGVHHQALWQGTSWNLGWQYDM